MSTSSQFSEEMEAMDVDEWNWMHDAYMREYARPPKRQPCWRRPKVFYTALCLVVASMVGLAVTGILMGTDGALSGWRPNQGSSGGGDGDDTTDGTGGFPNTEPSPSPTAAPTVSPTMAATNSATQAPTRGPRTSPLAFYVIGDGTYHTCRTE